MLPAGQRHRKHTTSAMRSLDAPSPRCHEPECEEQGVADLVHHRIGSASEVGAKTRRRYGNDVMQVDRRLYCTEALPAEPDGMKVTDEDCDAHPDRDHRGEHLANAQPRLAPGEGEERGRLVESAEAW